MEPESECRCGGERWNRRPNVVAAGQAATPAAFYLGLCRLRGNLSAPASATVTLQAGRSSVQQRWCCRRAALFCRDDDSAAGGTILLCCNDDSAAGGTNLLCRNDDSAAGGTILLWCNDDSAAGGTILLCRNDDSAAGGPLLHTTTIGLHRFQSLALKSRIDARKIV